MLSEKFQSLFTQSYTPGEGWNDYKLFMDVLPKEVAKTSNKPSNLPVCSWMPDPEMIDSCGIRSLLDAKEDSTEVPSPDEKAQVVTAGEERERYRVSGTARKVFEKKKDLEKPEQLFKTEFCKQWKDGKVSHPIDLT